MNPFFQSRRRCRGILSTLFALLFLATMTRAADTITYTYDPAGRLTGADFGNGQSITYSYDAAGNITRKTVAAIVDTDGDGMDDNWERQYFNNSLARDGAGDFDNDGATDLAEYLAGTLPNDSTSVLKVTRGVLDTGTSFTIEWTAVSGKRYRVQYKNSVSDPNWTDLPGDVTASGNTASKQDTTVVGVTQRYYRVLLVP